MNNSKKEQAPEQFHLGWAGLIGCCASFLLAACDQSINELGSSETKLTGMYCDAKGAQEQNCKAGDVVVSVEGREQLLCDWGWQIVHEPGSDEILCVYRGQLRETRPPPVKAQ